MSLVLFCNCFCFYAFFLLIFFDDIFYLVYLLLVKILFFLLSIYNFVVNSVFVTTNKREIRKEEVKYTILNFEIIFSLTLITITPNKYYIMSRRTSCPKDLNWDCKGWKEGHVMCCWNRILKLFLVMD